MHTKHRWIAWALSAVVVVLLIVGVRSLKKGIGNDQGNNGVAPLPFSAAATTTTYAYHVDVPATGNIVLDAAVRAYVDERIGSFVETYGPSKFTPEDMNEIGVGTRYLNEQFIEGKPWQFKTISGMHVEDYEFTGGAHGGTSLAPFAFDEKGNNILLKDLFLPESDYLGRLTAVIRPRLKAQLDENGMYLDDMFFPGTEPKEENYAVFSLSDAGITFTFGQYQVAPYAAGMQQITVPFSEVKDILSEGYF